MVGPIDDFGGRLVYQTCEPHPPWTQRRRAAIVLLHGIIEHGVSRRTDHVVAKIDFAGLEQMQPRKHGNTKKTIFLFRAFVISWLPFS